LPVPTTPPTSVLTAEAVDVRVFPLVAERRQLADAGRVGLR
jgi:hypothetical protein